MTSLKQACDLVATWNEPRIADACQAQTSNQVSASLSKKTRQRSNQYQRLPLITQTTTHQNASKPKSMIPNGIDYHIAAVPQRKESVIPTFYYKAPKSCNPHIYRYILNNPYVCLQQRKVFLLMLIRSTASAAAQRKVIRDTWGAKYNIPDTVMPLLFLVGLTSSLIEQKQLKHENERHNDIIQEDFKDVFENSSLKTTMGYKWAWTYCPHAEFVLMANDDIIVDVFKLVPYLRTLHNRPRHQYSLCFVYPCCMLAEHSISRWQQLAWKNNGSETKWKIDHKNEFNNHINDKYGFYTGSAYPTHCSTTAYIAPSQMIHDLYRMSVDTPLISPEAAWLGILGEKLGVSFLDTNRCFTGIREDAGQIWNHFNSSTYLESQVLVAVIGNHFPKLLSEHMRMLWQVIIENHRDTPILEAQPFLMSRSNNRPDNHIYTVAAVALILDLVVVAFIAYLIACRRKKHHICKG